MGLQQGFEDKTKGTIFFDIAKIIKMTRPKVVFLENVQNLLSHDKQATFKTIVDTLDRQLDYHIVGVTHDEKGETQYERSAFLRNSRDFGVPQNRPRVYIVAFSRAYFGQHISILPKEAPSKRSRTPVFENLKDVLDEKVDPRFFLSSGYLETLEKHIVTQHDKGYGFGYCIVIITDQGTDLRDSAYAEIWKDLKTWAVDAKERALLSELENSSDLFLLKEKPYRDCIFQIGGNEEQYKCDLFWKESQVALFTSDNEDCYEVARNCDIYCIYCADDTVTVRKILDALKGR